MNAFWINTETLEAVSNQNLFPPPSVENPAHPDHHVEFFHQQTLPGDIETIRFKRCSENRPSEDELANSIAIRCPRCQQSHEVIASRLQKRKPIPKRWIFHYFRCCVCDCRFKELNPDGLLTVLFLMAVMIVSPIVIAYFF